MTTSYPSTGSSKPSSKGRSSGVKKQQKKLGKSPGSKGSSPATDPYQFESLGSPAALGHDSEKANKTKKRKEYKTKSVAKQGDYCSADSHYGGN